jgi:hypothetical protein
MQTLRLSRSDLHQLNHFPAGSNHDRAHPAASWLETRGVATLLTMRVEVLIALARVSKDEAAVLENGLLTSVSTLSRKRLPPGAAFRPFGSTMTTKAEMMTDAQVHEVRFEPPKSPCPLMRSLCS